SNTWSGEIRLLGEATIGVDNQNIAASGDRLTISGRIRTDASATGVTDLNLKGFGEVDFTGSGSNDFNGTTKVDTLTLRLGKTSGVTAIPGDLLIGPFGGGPGVSSWTATTRSPTPPRCRSATARPFSSRST